MAENSARHWDAVYAGRPSDSVSWFQPQAEVSLRLLTSLGRPDAPLVDVGGGASVLADDLLHQGWSDVTVLDVSAEALALVASRLAGHEPTVQTVVTDLLQWSPDRAYELWHDRAVLHFLTDVVDRDRYVDIASRAVRPGGFVVVGAFAEDGPTQCSGLPTARYSASRLADVFGGGFELVHSEREEHRTPGGAVQLFTWVVLRHVSRPG